MEKIDVFMQNYCGYRGYEKFQYEKTLKSSIIIEVKTRGYEGGSCYGSSSQEFSKSEEDQKSDFFDGLFYLKNFLKDSFNISEKSFNDWREDIYEKIKYSEIGTVSSSFDYYGNGSEYNIYSIELSNVFIDFKIDSVYIDYILERKKILELEKLDEENMKKLNELKEKLNSFDDNKIKEFKNLKNIRSQLIKKLEDNQKNIDDFEIRKEKELNDLNSKISQLEKKSNEKNKFKY